MSAITIAGIPLFDSTQEASAWAKANGLHGYHTHGFKGQVLYMGGASHAEAVQAIRSTSTTQTTPTPTPTPTRTPTRTSTPTRTRTSGGGGGGSGY